MRRRDFLIGAGALAAGAGLEHWRNKREQKNIEQQFETASVEETLRLIVKHTGFNAQKFKDALNNLDIGGSLVVYPTGQMNRVTIDRLGYNHFHLTIEKHFGQPLEEPSQPGQTQPLKRPNKPRPLSRA